MDLNQLELFRKVAEARSFSAAAGGLGVRRSSVSRAVASLERALGVQLFARTTRSVALTTAGTALYQRVKLPLHELGKAVGTLPEREEEPSGVLRITSTPDFGAVVLPPILASFTLRHPAVSVDVHLTYRAVDLVAEGFDVALRGARGRMKSSSLVARRVTELPFQLFAAPDYLARAGTPRSPADTAAHDWIAFRPMRPPPAFPRPERPPRIVGDDALFVLAAARAGLGLAFLPAFLAAKDVTTGALVRVLPRVAVPAGSLYLVHPPAKHVPRKVTAFQTHLLEHFSGFAPR